MKNPNLIDATPLPQPANPWSFGAAVLASAMAHLPAKTPEQVKAKAELKGRVQWLKHLGKQINTGHTNPVLLMALSAAALDGQVRKWMIECLREVERVTRAAQGLPPEEEPVPVVEEVEDEGEPAPPPGV